MKRYCLTLDLKNDPKLIAEYDHHHRKVWSEVLDSIKQSGILSMEIYRLQTRLFMILEAADDFSFEKKFLIDSSNSKVQEWEELMGKYQERLPMAQPGEKWMVMDKIFELI